jgi:hypothetical protein
MDLDILITERPEDAHINTDEGPRPLSDTERQSVFLKKNDGEKNLVVFAPIDRLRQLEYIRILLPNPCTLEEFLEGMYKFYQTPVDQEYLSRFPKDDITVKECRNRLEEGRQVVKRFELLGLGSAGGPLITTTEGVKRRDPLLCIGLVRYECILIDGEGDFGLMLGS